MAEARKDRDREPVADNAAGDLSRLAEASSKLFAEQAAAMAVMTVYSIRAVSELTSMMLGAFRGPAVVEGSVQPAPAEPKSTPSERKSSAEVVSLRLHPPKAAEAKAADAVVGPAAKAARPIKTKKAAPGKSTASKPVRRAAAAVSGRDDLKTISGIGPRLEQELNARGIVLYADVARLSKAAVKKLDAELGLEGRILRDDWAGQAKALSGGKG